jgi:hypothetical protein
MSQRAPRRLVRWPMIRPMRDPTRIVLVMSQRPHAWALLRDRLDPSLVEVAWRPAESGGSPLEPPPWALVGDLGAIPAGLLEQIRGNLVAVHWVGAPPAGLPARPRLHRDWQELADTLGQGLRACTAGLRLAPAHGLMLPGGRFLRQTGPLEVLLGLHPEGLELNDPDGALGAAARRIRRLLERTGAPLELRVAGASLRLVEKSDVGAA